MSNCENRRKRLRRAEDRRRELSRFRLQMLATVLLALLVALMVYMVATYPYGS